MPQTNTEVQRKFKERQLIYNREEYLQKKRDNYKKKFKDDIEPEEEIKEEFIILRPDKKRQAPLNKTIIKDETKKSLYKKFISYL
jgi:hypothetical protein